MSSVSFFTAVTTIQPPTNCMAALSEKLQSCNGEMIVVGDAKGVQSYELGKATFLSIKDQLELGFSLGDVLPTCHYSRKNIAYMHAIQKGATCIYETDDDNKPLDHWYKRSSMVSDSKLVNASGNWVNIYDFFTNEKIWPRGLPLDKISEKQTFNISEQKTVYAPIQQGLVNNSPDVDAVWRLVLDKPFDFDSDKTESICLAPYTWSPFNTQSTWWWEDAFPLMYIPSYCSFRMCDIWKSFVAQRCLWELDCGVVFHPPEVIQNRNLHNLMRDFEDELEGYCKNELFKNVLAELTLEKGNDAIAGNLIRCYEALIANGFFPEDEISLVERWCSDLNTVRA